MFRPGSEESITGGALAPMPGEVCPAHSLRARLRDLLRALGQVAYGMTVYEMVRDARRERARCAQVFATVTFGDLAGLPIAPSCYRLRLLPFLVPYLSLWRRSVLRERDLTDLCEQEIA